MKNVKNVKNAGKKKPGRPKGSRTTPRDHVEGKLTRCRACGSTDREPYTQTITTPFAANDNRTGQPYTHIVRRWTKCSACGQARVDFYRENRAGQKPTRWPVVSADEMGAHESGANP